MIIEACLDFGSKRGTYRQEIPLCKFSHDPLTVAHVIDPGILKLKNYFIAVETSGEMTAGETVGYARAPIFKSAPLKTRALTADSPDAPFRPNAMVAIDVQSEHFFHLFLQRLSGRA